MSTLPITDPQFKGLIPPLTPEEREQLEQNILEHRRCHDPIVLWEGIILDGHNRYEICFKHGVEFQIVELELESREAAKVWILENQLSRRNLNDAARIELALLKVDMLREKARRKQSYAGGDKTKKPGDKGAGALSAKVSKPELETAHVRKAIADEVGVSERTLHSYMQIKKHGTPQLQAAVQSGQLKIGTAHRLLSKEILRQLTHAGKMLAFIKSARPPEGYEAADPEIHAKLTNLAKSMTALLEKLDEQDNQANQGGAYESA